MRAIVLYVAWGSETLNDLGRDIVQHLQTARLKGRPAA